MAIPKINEQNIIDALKYIDKHGIPLCYQIKKYALITEEGRYYPPNYVIAVANHIKNSVEISTDGISTQQAIKYFQDHGFIIEVKDKINPYTFIPEINEQNIIDALKYIDEHGVPLGYQSKKYKLVTNEGKDYPPNYVIAVAKHIKNGTNISKKGIGTQQAIKYFKEHGFKIITKNKTISYRIHDFSGIYYEIRYIFDFAMPFTTDTAYPYSGFGIESRDKLSKIGKELGERFKHIGLINNKGLLNATRPYVDKNKYDYLQELWFNQIFTFFDGLDEGISSEIIQSESPLKRKIYRKIEEEKKNNTIFKIEKGPDTAITFWNEIASKNKLETRKLKFSIYRLLNLVDKFSPFSSIGYWLKYRLQSYTRDSIPLFFHGLNPCLGSMQDIYYQMIYYSCLSKNGYIYIQDGLDEKIGPFKLYGLGCDNNTLYIDEEKPYLRARYYFDEKNYKDCRIYTNGELKYYWYKKISRKNEPENKNELPKVFIEEEQLINYEFWLLNHNVKETENSEFKNYILRKIEESPFKYTSKKVIQKDITSFPYSIEYYPKENINYSIIEYTYIIPERRQDSFIRWANSFGDFAYYNEKNNEKNKLSYPYWYVRGQVGKMHNSNINDDNKSLLTTLFNPQNSECTLKQLGEDNLYDIEYDWLKMISSLYPNWCKLVFPKNDNLFECGNDSKTIPYLFADLNYGIRPLSVMLANSIETKGVTRIWGSDLAENDIEKLSKIIDGIWKIKIYQIEDEHKNYNEIIPYVIDVDFELYNRRGREASRGIQIVAYDLRNKRVISIPLEKFNTNNELKEYRFVIWDKLYYLAAHLVRVHDSIMQYIRANKKPQISDCMKKEILSNEVRNMIGNDIKFTDDELELLLMYTNHDRKGSKKMDLSITEYNEEMYNECFKEYYDKGVDKVFLKRNYKANIEYDGVSFYTIEETKYKKAIENTMVFLYKKIEENSKLDLIEILDDGFFIDYIVSNIEPIKDDNSKIEIELMNEVQFANSVLKIHELQLQLKEEIEFNYDTVSLIYSFFRNYNCVFPETKEKEKPIFIIQFQRYAFRRIHELILALSDYIEVPKERVEFKKDPRDRKDRLSHISKWKDLEQRMTSEIISYRSGKGKVNFETYLKENGYLT